MTKRSRFVKPAGFSPRVIQEVDEMQVMLGFVAAGRGIAFLSASIRHFQKPGGLPNVTPIFAQGSFSRGLAA